MKIIFDSNDDVLPYKNNEPTFYSFSISVNKCSGRCNNINEHMLNCVSAKYETRHIDLSIFFFLV